MVSLASKPEAASPAELALKLRILQRVFADKVTIDFGARRMSDVYTPRSLEPMLANFRKSFVSTTASMSDEELRIDKVRADIVFACRFRGKLRNDRLFHPHLCRKGSDGCGNGGKSHRLPL
jgi:hypothetical protein